MKRIICALACIFAILLVGCSAADNASSEEKNVEPAPEAKFFEVSANSDYTYSFKVFTRSGAALISEENYSVEPHAKLISDSVLKLWAGVGTSTRWVRYCDVDNKTVSDTYYGVLCEFDSKVVYTEFKDGAHYIIVKDIFDPESFVREFVLEDAAVAADPVAEVKETDGTYSLEVTYLAGLNKEPKNSVFEIK